MLLQWENKLPKLGDAIAISNLKLWMTHSLTDPLTDRGRCYLLSVGRVPRAVQTNREAVRLPALISAETSSSSYILTRSHPFLGSVWLGLACISATNLILYPPKPPRPRTSSHVLILYFILKRKLSKTCWGIECLIEFSSASTKSSHKIW